MTATAGLIVTAAGLWLCGLGVALVAIPGRTERFLSAFASSARAHYAELLLRLLAGAAFVIRSPAMWSGELFRAFGWVLVVTSGGLLLIPWQWHRWFAERAVPLALRFRPVMALGAFLLGAFVLYGLVA